MFNTQKEKLHNLENTKVSTRVILAMTWTSLMFLYIYVDYFALYMTGKIADIASGRIFVFDINQVFIFSALVSMSIPALMIFLCMMLPTTINRWTNIIIAGVFIPYSLFNLAGEVWIHMVIGAAFEVVLLSFIIYKAWNWPRINPEK